MTEPNCCAILEKRARHGLRSRSAGRTPSRVPAVRGRGLDLVRVRVATPGEAL